MAKSTATDTPGTLNKSAATASAHTAASNSTSDTGAKTSTATITSLNSNPGGIAKFASRLQRNWQSVVVGIPFFWLLLFFLAPFFIVLKISFAESLVAIPPFSDLLQWGEGLLPSISITTDNYAYMWEDDLYVRTYINSIKIATISTFLCLMIGYPIAYAIVRAEGATRYILLFLVILPFWTSFLLRVYAWMGLLADQGTFNNLMIWLGITDKPIRLLYTQFAVYVGIVYSYLPFMILPLYANMEKLDNTLREAAADLGAKPFAAFFTVTLPLTIPGIVAGCLLVFIPATGEFVIPDLLGGGNVLMIGRVLFGEFNLNRDWPVASAVAVALLILLVLPMMLYHRVQASDTEQNS